jgi:hypothetical protein
VLLILVAAVTLQGPFATAEAACGGQPLSRATEDSAFCKRLGVWQVALRNGDEWFIGPLPLQDGVSPRGVDGNLVRFSQHAFSADGIDEDGDWIWPCFGGTCAEEAVPAEIHARDGDAEVDISADVVTGPGSFDVVFRRMRITGWSARARRWRALVERLRGHHQL